MKFSLYKSAWLWTFELLSCSAILTGNTQNRGDITAIPKYGCYWSGGSNAMVNCTCREDVEVLHIRRGDIPVYDTWAIEINRCKKVIFDEHSIEDLRNLRHLHLRNIPSLILYPESLRWFGYRATNAPDDEEDDESIPSLNINIDQCHIERIAQHTFKGRLKRVIVDHCHIEEMESFAYSSLLQSETVTLSNTVIATLKPQAFKLFTSKQLILDNVTLHTLPSRAFSNLIVKKNLKISNSNFGMIFAGAFMIDGPKWFEVTNTNIKTLDGEGFTVSVTGDVLFRNNSIGSVNPGAFIEITPHHEFVTNTALFLTLDSNNFTTTWKNSFDVDGLMLKFVDLKLNETCSCEGLMSRYNKFRESFSEIKCKEGDMFISLKDYKSNRCNILSSHTTMIVIIGVVCCLLLATIVILFVYYHKVYKEGKYGNDKNEPTKNMSLIVPDGRTYRETEVHVILERADLLTTDL